MTDYVAGGRRIANVPHTTEAEGAAAVAAAIARRNGLPAAVWGMLILIGSESMLFGCMVASYFYLRFHNAQWPPAGVPKPDLLVPLVMLAVLVSTSVPMQLASRAVRRGRVGATRFFVLAALFVQAGYFAYEIHDYTDRLHQFDATTGAYGSIYFTLLGADHAHVLLGMLFSLWLLWKLARGLTTYRANATQAIAWYWHAVNVITIVVIGTLLSARA
ncbi:MAG: heme-copper oxidase subunit III [Actinobacteria bacterium]|nr:heme-copper oxidase subunit III [Actinomycetota bacterium]